MKWTDKIDGVDAVTYWIWNYESLKEYKLNPFENYSIFRGEKFIHGRTRQDSPTDELMDANWEFDKAIKSLGELGATVFKMRLLDGYSLEDCLGTLDFPDNEIKTHWRMCRRRLIKYLEGI